MRRRIGCSWTTTSARWFLRGKGAAMADAFSIDTSQLRELAADMRQVDSRVARWVRPVVERGAFNVKSDMQRAANESRHFRIARAISYDMHDRGFGGVGEYAAEIGPVKGRPGSLANIAYFGGANGGGGTVEDPQAAADRELPNFMNALADLAEEMVFDR